MSAVLDDSHSKSSEAFSPCIIVPFYNHGRYIKDVLVALCGFDVPIIITNDGSDQENSQHLQEAVNWAQGTGTKIRVTSHAQNFGKGVAVLSALQCAQHCGFTHALQVDADGQHTLSDVPALLSASRAEPNRLILTHPIFGKDAPLERIWGRKICNILVRLQTLSLSVKDAMIGFRVYPIAAVVSEHKAKAFRARMGFDIEVIVRLMRSGLKVSSLPSAVRYHTNGISHFKYGRDNIEIGLLHAELLLSGITSFISKLFGLSSKATTTSTSWFQKKERGSKTGIRFLFFVATACGKRSLDLLLWPVALYFFLADKQARFGSLRYLERITALRQGIPSDNLSHFTRIGLYPRSLAHIHSFAQATASGVLQWHNLLSKKPQTTPMLTELRKRLLAGSGGIILSAHFGALESARAQVSTIETVSIKPLMYHGNSAVYRSFLANVNPRSAEGLFFSDAFSVSELATCQSFIEKGGYLAVLADRPAPTNAQRTLPVQFLGETVHLPLGPFLLCHLLRVPVLALFCVFKSNGSFEFEFRDLFSGEPPRDRNQYLLHLSSAYAAAMEEACITNPLQWLNFYDYFGDAELERIRLKNQVPQFSGRLAND